jgi:hypothetical protein
MQDAAAAAAAAAAGGGGGDGGNRFARSQSRMSKEAARARDLRNQLGLEDASLTPQPGEELGAFFVRTADVWVARYLASGAIKEGTRVTGKALRRAAFGPARARYEEVWPLLVELHDVEEAQRAMEQEAAEEAGRAGRRAEAAAGSGEGSGVWWPGAAPAPRARVWGEGRAPCTCRARGASARLHLPTVGVQRCFAPHRVACACTTAQGRARARRVGGLHVAMPPSSPLHAPRCAAA